MPHHIFDEVDMRLGDLSHLELGHYTKNLADAFAVHPGYQDEDSFPHPLSKPAALNDLGSNFLVVVAAAESHDIHKVAELEALRPVVELHVSGVIHWAVMRSKLENNSSLIANLPVQTRKKPVRNASSATVHAPKNPKVKHGPDSGTVVVSVSKVDYARTYYLAFCTGDPSVEASWTISGPFDSCRKMEQSGLDPGKMYYFKVRCFGKGVMSSWSEIVSLRTL